MPVAICHICLELVRYKGAIYRAKHKCSGKLSAVSGKWNEKKQGYDYFDRAGNFRKYAPIDLKQFENKNNG